MGLCLLMNLELLNSLFSLEVVHILVCIRVHTHEMESRFVV